MAQQTHYFLAVSLPSTTRHLLSRWKELVEPNLPFKTWVHPKDYHITLAFLGSAASFTQIKAVKERIREVVLNHETFQLELTNLGVFGNQASPRILWSGVNHEPLLHELQKEVYEACTEIGFSLDKREFNPHITMARKWMGEEKFETKRLEQFGKPQDEFKTFLVENIVLYQTHMNRSPKYQPLTIFPLTKVIG